MLDTTFDSRSCVVVLDASHTRKVHLVIHVDFGTINNVTALELAPLRPPKFHVNNISVKRGLRL